MKMKIWFGLVCALFLSGPVFSNQDQEVRLAEALIAARQEQGKKNWVKIIDIAHELTAWGEKDGAKKALELAIPLIIARRSWAGALQVASVYKKLQEEERYRYWFAVYQKLYRDKDRKWKKY